MQRRLGIPQALTATAHTLARLLDSMRKHGTASVAQGREASEQQYQERVVKHLAREAKEWGYE